MALQPDVVVSYLTSLQNIGNEEDPHPAMVLIGSSDPSLRKSKTHGRAIGRPPSPLLYALAIGKEAGRGFGWKELRGQCRFQVVRNTQKCHQG
jgi:hypothetical protein